LLLAISPVSPFCRNSYLVSPSLLCPLHFKFRTNAGSAALLSGPAYRSHIWATTCLYVCVFLSHSDALTFFFSAFLLDPLSLFISFFLIHSIPSFFSSL
jgi:hypothetical protein